MPTKAPVRLGNLPCELTTFVGRRSELAAAKRQLARSRLVTLTGAGGMGKTRLALRVAEAVQRAFRDGVHLVELDQVHDEALVPQTVAAVLGLREQPGHSLTATLAEHLADKQALLLLDNCEHVINAAAELAESLLRASPQLRIVATSRKALEVRDETLMEVPSLATPDPAHPVSLGELGFVEAVSLFTDRAGTVAPGFALTRQNMAAVAQICHRLDGLPLAIELAAARLRVLSPEQINDRLQDRFRLLTVGSRSGPTRQHTLRACMEWSFELCTRAEQRLWAGLSIFEGGFELDSMAGICDAPDLAAGDLADLLAALVTKSIVVSEQRGPVTRFRMLESIRTFGRERLRDSGDEPAVRRRHRDWHERLVLRGYADWIGPRQVEWLDRFDRERPNIRVALEFSLTEEGQAASALRIGAALHSYWLIRGLATEGRHWLDGALAAGPRTTAERVRANFTATVLAAVQGDIAAATRLAEQGRQMADQLGDPWSDAIATLTSCAPATHSGDLARSAKLNQRALDMFQAQNDLYWTVNALGGLAMIRGLLGDAAGAAAHFEVLLSITHERGEIRAQGLALWALGIGLWKQGKPAEAAARLKESVRLRSQIKDAYGTGLCLDALAWIAAQRGRATRAATLLGVVGELSRRMGSPTAIYPDLLPYHEQCLLLTRQALDGEAFEAAFQQGTEMTIEDAVAYALADRTGPAQGPAGTLTQREWQICELVGEGLTNKQIAGRLVVSQRTVESHVQSALNKLGFNNRTVIAAWIAQLHEDPT